jgi:predicted Zn-dependent protease
VLGQAGATLLGLSYSREMERQADRLGTYYMALAAWAPSEALSMQRLLHSFVQREPGMLDRYLSTHPQLDDRLSEIEAVIKEKDLHGRGWLEGDGVYAQRWLRRTAEVRRVDEAFKPYDAGVRQLADRKYQQALESAEAALRNRTDQAPFHRLKGDALVGLNRLEEARAAYRRALQVDPRYAPANVGLGRAALQAGDNAQAEQQFTIAVRGFPGGAAAHCGLGYARYRQAKYSEAVAFLEAAAQAAPDDPDVLFVLAHCYDLTGRSADAYRAYRAALDAGLAGEPRSFGMLRVKELEPAATQRRSQ